MGYCQQYTRTRKPLDRRENRIRVIEQSKPRQGTIQRTVQRIDRPCRCGVLAADTRAALGLVMAQPSISSQLIDNLNASIHFRALLTDLFLVDEALKASLANPE